MFHDWKIEIKPTQGAAQITITIRDERKPTDKIQVVPADNAVVSDAKVGWVSGFDEPTQIPDFYLRTITFSDFENPATITIRKPIKSMLGMNQINYFDLDLDRQVAASAGKCQLVLHSVPSVAVHFPVLLDQLKAMMARPANGAGSAPIPTKLDPDAAYPPLALRESELVQEVKCSNSPCTMLLVELKEKTRVH